MTPDFGESLFRKHFPSTKARASIALAVDPDKKTIETILNQIFVEYEDKEALYTIDDSQALTGGTGR